MKEARFIFEREDYLNDVQDIPRAFSPYFTINNESEHYLKVGYSYNSEIFSLSILSDIFPNNDFSFVIKKSDIMEYKRLTKRFIKNKLYNYLSKELQIDLPYGSLTGVRPTKLYYELSKNMEDPNYFLVQNYFVSEKKANLIANCVKNQNGYINQSKNNIGFFINIPFCPSRCKYCSFISTEIFRVKNEIKKYVDCVKKEINNSLQIIKENNYKVKSIYVGGGTPTCIGAENLYEIISLLKDFNVEFTVEAGRPDTITDEIVDSLIRANVTRVSVNPQTFSNRTLAIVGRKHTVEDFYRCFELIKKTNFIINTDLIAGLPQETFNDFKYSVDKCIELSPDNITIHALSLKRGSIFSECGKEKEEFGLVGDMIDYAHSALNSNNYVPYYMYRQKNTADNLENTGYTKTGKQCVYNIDMMEESVSIIGIGAGAISKNISDAKIERMSSPKGFREYCERIDDTIHKKKIFFVQ